MPLSWNEIKDRAVNFSKEWKDAFNENADGKPFLVAFFNVFGINQRKVGTFEFRIKKLDDHDGYIDMLWKGNLLIEMKSRGKDLGKAWRQANDYMQLLKQHELPRYVLLCDFARFRLIDLEGGEPLEFRLEELVNHVHHFGFIAGYFNRPSKPEDAVNIAAAELMGRLHDDMKEAGYSGHELEKYLVRLLFCLFAEDSGIFEPRGIFYDYLVLKTSEDGSDLGLHLAQIFQVLNTPPQNRQLTLDESLAQFPYVNGQLFAEQLSFASFNSKMRKTLIACCHLDWGRISPAIFGSMFQSVMNPVERRNLGAHYTSEKNIMKLIRPLFLDKLREEFENSRNSPYKLRALHKKIASLRFLDPACGCGNFLVITYREIRLLELAILKQLFQFEDASQTRHVNLSLVCDVDRFYGIEVEEFPAQIAQVAMWLMDHQMNLQASLEFGEYYVRLPLKASARITHGNALRTDWNNLIELLPWESNEGNARFNYILGNPPFIGSKMMTQIQRNEVTQAFENIEGCGVLDYVSAWYAKAAKYLQTEDNHENAFPGTKVAFVSTNSISQGEQVGLLWQYLILKNKITINFAHRTFKWSNEARGVAAVYCVIIGFSKEDELKKRIFTYPDIKGDPEEMFVSHINPYLVDGKDIFIRQRQHPICPVPEMNFGNMPLDGGNLLLTDGEKIDLTKLEPEVTRYIRPLISAREFLNNEKRWCLWLVDAEPAELRKLPLVMERIEKVKQFRLASVAPSTQKFASTPALFRDRNNPESFILIPSTSSENRKYVPFGFLSNFEIANNSCHFIPNGTLFHFGILTSEMHMTWVRYVCGRLKSDFRYSKDIVYNNFPWPENPMDKQREAIEKAAQQVLDVRNLFPGSSLADLYDPLTMPPALVKAHRDLDRAVDLAYRPQPFPSETKRIEFLFELYDKYTAGLFPATKKKKKLS